MRSPILLIALCFLSPLAMAQAYNPIDSLSLVRDTVLIRYDTLAVLSDSSFVDSLQFAVSPADSHAVDMLATKEADAIQPVSRKLFSEAVRATCPAVALDYVEAAYLQHFSGVPDSVGRFADITFPAGSWDMLRLVNDSTPCSLSLLNGRTYVITWQDLAQMRFPVHYQNLLGGSRSEIESRLIARLSDDSASPSAILPDSIPMEQLAGSDCLQVSGDTYGITQVNRNFYLREGEDGLAHLVYDSLHAEQSMANLFVCGNDTLVVPMTITIPKHEYGERVVIQTSLATLSSVCAMDGCVAYWGTEAVSDTLLRGAVFLYNQALGYDHVLRVECDPRLIGTDRLTIDCRMSLFIPTTNVKELYAEDGHKQVTPEVDL